MSFWNRGPMAESPWWDMYGEGKISDEAGFAQFLKKPLEATGVATAQAGGGKLSSDG